VFYTLCNYGPDFSILYDTIIRKSKSQCRDSATECLWTTVQATIVGTPAGFCSA